MRERVKLCLRGLPVQFLDLLGLQYAFANVGPFIDVGPDVDRRADRVVIGYGGNG